MLTTATIRVNAKITRPRSLQDTLNVQVVDTAIAVHRSVAQVICYLVVGAWAPLHEIPMCTAWSPALSDEVCQVPAHAH